MPCSLVALYVIDVSDDAEVYVTPPQLAVVECLQKGAGYKGKRSGDPAVDEMKLDTCKCTAMRQAQQRAWTESCASTLNSEVVNLDRAAIWLVYRSFTSLAGERGSKLTVII